MNLQRRSATTFGLVAWLEQTQIHLPLKAIECRFEASGAAVDVQIDQIFHQSAGRPLDVTYSFPLPSKAAVYRCEMIVIDHAVNEAFLRQLSGQQRGISVFLTPNDDLVRPIAILGSRLSRPAFTHLSLEGNWELAGAELPDIYAGQVVFAPIRTLRS
jgi:Vault protein inter-alpha-trypsin domain